MLEIIALNVEDALAAAEGGADRIELVGTMDSDGLSATVEQVRQIRAACSIPIRAMVRDQAGFVPRDLGALAQVGCDLRDAGAEALVIGWVRDGIFDHAAVHSFISRVGGCELTIHRAVDNVADYAAGWRAILGLPNVTSVLTAGSSAGVDTGMKNVLAQAADPRIADLMMVGGGLRLEHLPTLKAAGIGKFYVGSAVRDSFDSPIDPLLVEKWVAAVRA